jgi:hypothetical protein
MLKIKQMNPLEEQYCKFEESTPDLKISEVDFSQPFMNFCIDLSHYSKIKQESLETLVRG